MSIAMPPSVHENEGLSWNVTSPGNHTHFLPRWISASDMPFARISASQAASSGDVLALFDFLLSAAVLPAAFRFRVSAAFFPAALCFFLSAAFFPAAFAFRVFHAFFAASFLDVDVFAFRGTVRSFSRDERSSPQLGVCQGT